MNKFLRDAVNEVNQINGFSEQSKELTYEPTGEGKTAAELEPGYYWAKSAKFNGVQPVGVFGDIVGMWVTVVGFSNTIKLDDVELLQKLEYKGKG